MIVILLQPALFAIAEAVIGLLLDIASMIVVLVNLFVNTIIPTPSGLAAQLVH